MRTALRPVTNVSQKWNRELWNRFRLSELSSYPHNPSQPDSQIFFCWSYFNCVPEALLPFDSQSENLTRVLLNAAGFASPQFKTSGLNDYWRLRCDSFEASGGVQYHLRGRSFAEPGGQVVTPLKSGDFSNSSSSWDESSRLPASGFRAFCVRDGTSVRNHNLHFQLLEVLHDKFWFQMQIVTFYCNCWLHLNLGTISKLHIEYNSVIRTL